MKHLPRLILLVSSLGLIPIALSYGVSPRTTTPMLFGFSADAVDAAHILRAVMGLYLAMAALWLAGWWTPRLRPAALVSLATFMLGLAGGRLLSFVLDGRPAPLLISYFMLEVSIGVLALWAYRQVAGPVR
ncbi:MAG: DUF4345 domain-containing protein [Proteobacteria bacterium]|nr:DUF4345 domain-containing protein [Pseudomonadota bacterium]